MRIAFTALAMFLYLLQAAFAQPQPDPSLPKEFSGDPVGIEDPNGKRIIPAKYSRISYCGNGLFLAIGIDPHHAYTPGSDVHLFSAKGKRVRFKVPPGTSLIDVFSLGKSLDTDLAKPVSKLPNDALLKFAKENFTGLCGPTGDVILPLQKGTICFLRPGLGYIAEDTPYLSIEGKQNKLIDLATGTLRPDHESLMPKERTMRVLATTQKATRPPVKLSSGRTITYKPIGPGFQEVSVHTDNGKFNRDYWLSYKTFPVSKLNMFGRFLNDYDLIGMRVDRVLSLLGVSGTGHLRDCGCEPVGYNGDFKSLTLCVIGDTLRVRINFARDRVESWQFIYGTEERALITNDVVLLEPRRAARIGEGVYDSVLQVRQK